MITYSVIRTKSEKEGIKAGFFSLFESVYMKSLKESDWEHQFVHSPYDDTVMFIVSDGDKIVGSSVMIRQTLSYDGESVPYYLFTSSAILTDYRTYGIYPELLKMQKEYASENGASFIFAFPNETAFPVLKLFGRFKVVGKYDLVKTDFKNFNINRLSDALKLDENMFCWRFEHKPYYFSNISDKIVIFKDYEGVLDMLAVYDKASFGHDFADTAIEQDATIITLDANVIDRSVCETFGRVNATYFALNNDVDFEKVNINLLMSDVF